VSGVLPAIRCRKFRRLDPMKLNRVAIVLAVMSVAVTGCSSNTQAVTVGNAAKPSTSAAPVQTGSQRVLTADEIQKTLPTVDQVGTGWALSESDEPASTPSPDATTFTPAQCAFSAQEGDSVLGITKSDVKPQAEGQVTFKQGTDSPFDVHQTSVSIKSYADNVDTSGIVAAASKLAECSKFTSTDSGGVTSSFELFPLSLPNYGDKTLAFRLQGGAGMFIIVGDVVGIVLGHNVITVAQFGLGKIDTELAGRVATNVMANLNTVTGTK
jgi:hypothetical protein